nr:hypothetical protein [uncultured Desulfobulbus sp.]
MERRGLEPTKRVAYFEYDFTRDGGAIGDITLRGDSLPDDAVVTGGMVQVKTTCTGGASATISLKVESAADVMAATAMAGLVSNALIDVEPDGTAANAIRTTENGRQVVATIATAALTAGKLIVALEYL